jgi:hypothetical protein
MITKEKYAHRRFSFVIMVWTSAEANGARSMFRWSCLMPSVTELETDIRKWITEWNKDPKPFMWTKSADEILETLAAYCQRIIDSEH